ncbi:MAG: hypothetical protein IPP06_16625 [Saprospiraceae bacterium]|nr:hypothetical protein [Candidatus Vicinibacter affinis]
MEYATSNSIPILEIPYTAIDRVEELVTKFLELKSSRMYEARTATAPSLVMVGGKCEYEQ